MAKQKKKQQFNWQQFLAARGQVVSTGILALIMIILVFLALDTLSQTKKSTKNNQTEKKTEQTKKDTQKPSENTKTEKKAAKEQSSTSYTTVQGDNLWKIAVKFYNDGYKWTQIAKENNIANPDKIKVGQALKISLAISTPASNTSKPASQEMKITYTVHKGDSLWGISQKFYSGNGYNWVHIQWANPDKVGLLANGRPLIKPGTILIIPQLK